MSDEVKHVDLTDDEEDHEDHPLPMGALVMTLAYLALITTLWLDVYFQLLSNGGILRP